VLPADLTITVSTLPLTGPRTGCMPVMLDRARRGIISGQNVHTTMKCSYRSVWRLALAALKPVARPAEAMVDAAHEAVWSDAYWAISGRADTRLLDTNKDLVVNQRAKRPVALQKNGRG
jgi:hypothetical protein